MPTIDTIITYISDIIESVWNFLTFPNQLKEDLAASILDLMREYNLDPVYTTTVFVNLILLSYWGNFRKWKTQTTFIRHSAIITVAGAVVGNLWSLLKLLGVIDF